MDASNLFIWGNNGIYGMDVDGNVYKKNSNGEYEQVSNAVIYGAASMADYIKETMTPDQQSAYKRWKQNKESAKKENDTEDANANGNQEENNGEQDSDDTEEAEKKVDLKEELANNLKTMSEVMASFIDTCKKVNDKFNSNRAVYTQYLYFEFHGNVLIDTTSLDYSQNCMVSFKNTQEGATEGAGNTFEARLAFAPNPRNYQTIEKIDKKLLVVGQITTDSTNCNELKSFSEYFYNCKFQYGYADDPNLRSPMYKGILTKYTCNVENGIFIYTLSGTTTGLAVEKEIRLTQKSSYLVDENGNEIKNPLLFIKRIFDVEFGENAENSEKKGLYDIKFLDNLLEDDVEFSGGDLQYYTQKNLFEALKDILNACLTSEEKEIYDNGKFIAPTQKQTYGYYIDPKEDSDNPNKIGTVVIYKVPMEIKNLKSSLNDMKDKAEQKDDDNADENNSKDDDASSDNIAMYTDPIVSFNWFGQASNGAYNHLVKSWEPEVDGMVLMAMASALKTNDGFYYTLDSDGNIVKLNSMGAARLGINLKNSSVVNGGNSGDGVNPGNSGALNDGIWNAPGQWKTVSIINEDGVDNKETLELFLVCPVYYDDNSPSKYSMWDCGVAAAYDDRPNVQDYQVYAYDIDSAKYKYIVPPNVATASNGKYKQDNRYYPALKEARKYHEFTSRCEKNNSNFKIPKENFRNKWNAPGEWRDLWTKDSNKNEYHKQNLFCVYPLVSEKKSEYYYDMAVSSNKDGSDYGGDYQVWIWAGQDSSIEGEHKEYYRYVNPRNEKDQHGAALREARKYKKFVEKCSDNPNNYPIAVSAKMHLTKDIMNPSTSDPVVSYFDFKYEDPNNKDSEWNNIYAIDINGNVYKVENGELKSMGNMNSGQENTTGQAAHVGTLIEEDDTLKSNWEDWKEQMSKKFEFSIPSGEYKGKYRIDKKEYKLEKYIHNENDSMVDVYPWESITSDKTKIFEALKELNPTDWDKYREWYYLDPNGDEYKVNNTEANQEEQTRQDIVESGALVNTIQEYSMWSQATQYCYNANITTLGLPCEFPIMGVIQVNPIIGYGVNDEGISYIHHTGGKYYILKKEDTMDSSGFYSRLQLIKIETKYDPSYEFKYDTASNLISNGAKNLKNGWYEKDGQYWYDSNVYDDNDGVQLATKEQYEEWEKNYNEFIQSDEYKNNSDKKWDFIGDNGEFESKIIEDETEDETEDKNNE